MILNDLKCGEAKVQKSQDQDFLLKMMFPKIKQMKKKLFYHSTKLNVGLLNCREYDFNVKLTHHRIVFCLLKYRLGDVRWALFTDQFLKVEFFNPLFEVSQSQLVEHSTK